jgi:hypothetical protein
VAGLMRAVKRMNATGKFNWIGSDGWSARALVSKGKLFLQSNKMGCPALGIWVGFLKQPTLPGEAPQKKFLQQKF